MKPGGAALVAGVPPVGRLNQWWIDLQHFFGAGPVATVFVLLGILGLLLLLVLVVAQFEKRRQLRVVHAGSLRVDDPSPQIRRRGVSHPTPPRRSRRAATATMRATGIDAGDAPGDAGDEAVWNQITRWDRGANHLATDDPAQEATDDAESEPAPGAPRSAQDTHEASADPPVYGPQVDPDMLPAFKPSTRRSDPPNDAPSAGVESAVS